MTDDDLVIIAQLGAPFGVRGEAKVTPFTDDPKNFLKYKRLFIKIKKEWVPLELESKRLGGGALFVKIKGVDSPEVFKMRYRNNEIAILKSDLPKLAENEFYWVELYGLQVINEEGIHLGTITLITETPGTHDTLYLSGGDKDRAIPYRWHDIIISVDLLTKTMRVNWDPSI